jgi:hypothetical protein
MTKAGLAFLAAALVAGGVTIGWWAARPGAVSPATPTRDDVDALRSAASEQTARIHRLESRASADAETARVADALKEHAARIETLERAAASRASASPTGDPNAADAGSAASADLERLKAIADGRRTVAIRDAVAALVRGGDASVPDIAAFLQSGFDRAYGGGLLMQGNAVGSYPSLRLALMDALRQIGTTSARSALIEVWEHSDRPADCPAVWMFWDGGFTDQADPAIVAGLSALTSSALRKVAASGLESAECGTTNGAAVSILWWVLRHPVPQDAAALEQLVLLGRPKDEEASDLFEKFFDALAEAAPEKAAIAAQTLQQRDPGRQVIFALSQGFGGYVGRANQARYFTALFSQGDVPVRQRIQLYDDYVPRGLETAIADPAKRVAEAQVFVRFWESRVTAETDAEAKALAERSLAQLREAIEKAQKQ